VVLSAGEVKTGMSSVAPRIHECNGTAEQGVVQVKVEIRSDGSVESATASGHWARTIMGWCAAHLFCDVRFPRFTDTRQFVLYPYMLE
jgi:hypothetical protein